MISTTLKWVTGILEGLLAIPIAGGLFILGSGWQPLMFMFVLHLITLIFSVKDSRFSAGSVLGLITSVVGIIPGIGWLMHTITAIVLVIDASIPSKAMNSAK
ncbi:hypothetical protein SAMN05421743_103103 [Thalassobacillus cyri]|uniref:Uncharacterized protein n=1 Tax=Thalassobacillus cyri TaxID=571932 RepID=A0A1H3Z3F3_9BACI|nr:hypothetical protein [Thalassobacillus cyri]SEA17914.1 hypothetical protein SAMN05421743_103103 [Thalassobacillus cyri]